MIFTLQVVPFVIGLRIFLLKQFSLLEIVRVGVDFQWVFLGLLCAE
jgi:hypothetical protein